MNSRLFVSVLWLFLALFFAWDWFAAIPVNVFAEPPLIALGSGTAPSGAHCASTF